MRNLIFTLMVSPFSCFSQLTAPDFTLSDIDGNTHNLYQETDAGKTVVLDFFSTTCGTCITNTPSLENIWLTYGFMGDSIWVWGIESTGVSDSMIHIFENTYHSTFPLSGTSNDSSVISQYNISYTPQYFIVCPDKTMKPYDIGNVADGIAFCGPSGNEEKEADGDIKIYAYKSEVFIENEGKNALNGSLEIYDHYSRTITLGLNVNPSDKSHTQAYVYGIVFYRLSDSSGNLLKKGKLFLSH
jgi:peroxiredoxin